METCCHLNLFFFFTIKNRIVNVETVFKHVIFPSLLSPFPTPSRLAAIVLVVPSDLLDAECRGRGLHLGGA